MGHSCVRHTLCCPTLCCPTLWGTRTSDTPTRAWNSACTRHLNGILQQGQLRCHEQPQSFRGTDERLDLRTPRFDTPQNRGRIRQPRLISVQAFQWSDKGFKKRMLQQHEKGFEATVLTDETVNIVQYSNIFLRWWANKVLHPHSANAQT